MVSEMKVSKMSSYRTHLGIVVGVDGSPPSRVAADWAARDAELRNLPLTLVHVVSPMYTSWFATMLSKVFGRPPVYERARRIIDDAVKTIDDSTGRAGPLRINTKVVFAKTIATLVELSADAELVVVGSGGRGALRRVLFGSVSSALVAQSHCPVAVIHDEDPLMPDPAHAPVLVAVGGSVGATILARQEAARRGVELVVSHAPAPRLVEQSESAQLVVVGDRYGRRSVGAAVAQAARMPVIVA